MCWIRSSAAELFFWFGVIKLSFRRNYLQLLIFMNIGEYKEVHFFFIFGRSPFLPFLSCFLFLLKEAGIWGFSFWL